ncbi:hypothetical protein HMPREF9098_2284 [Kingella denitrificans ATCC 33394]|uniref:Uncharacterized protein n=1 Tax=Kingella denitrificans ATCC 33394 TaxID=888741 RepID=F0F2E9_9NEIS|nr:hypothetical protein HMPREF9098_2284 [Kingella denitrificans ATCC 33394]
MIDVHITSPFLILPSYPLTYPNYPFLMTESSLHSVFQSAGCF